MGDAVRLADESGSWIITDENGIAIGRMSKAYSPPEGTTFVSGQVDAMLRWRKSDNGEDYQYMMQRDEWDVVLPEFVFHPLGNALIHE